MALPAVKQINAPNASGTVVAMAIPLAAETILPVDDLILHVKTTGTSTTVTITDPGTTVSGSQSVNPAIVMGATEERFIYIPSSMANPATGLINVAFSGALTGVTGEWLRA